MSPSERPPSLRDEMKHIHLIAGRFMNRGHAGFEYEEINEALGLALQELSLIRRCADKALEDPEGQEYAYRVVSEDGPGVRRFSKWARSEHAAKRAAANTPLDAWVERALLGTWEKLD